MDTPLRNENLHFVSIQNGRKTHLISNSFYIFGKKKIQNDFVEKTALLFQCEFRLKKLATLVKSSFKRVFKVQNNSTGFKSIKSFKKLYKYLYAAQ